MRLASDRNQVRRSVSSIQFFEQARRRDVAVLVGDLVRPAHALGERVLIVLAQLGQHVLRGRRSRASLSRMR